MEPSDLKTVDSIEDVLVSLPFASWNLISISLAQINGLRGAASLAACFALERKQRRSPHQMTIDIGRHYGTYRE